MRVHLTLIAACVAAFVVCANAGGSPVPTDKIQIVLNKLEAFVKQGAPKSTVNFADLVAADNEFRQWTMDQRLKMRRSMPLLHLLADFALVPMERYPNLVEDSDDMRQMFVTRLELGYKKFRSGYLGGMVGLYYLRSINIEALSGAMLGLKDSKPVTMRLLKDAKREFDAYTDKFYEIGMHEDIFASLQELERLINFLHRKQITALDKVVLSKADEITEDQLASVAAAYKREVERSGYVVIDGVLYRSS